MIPDNVISLPATTTFTPEQALLSTLEFCRADNLSNVLVIGYDGDGDLVVRSSKMDRAEALFMIKKAEAWTLHEGLIT